MNTTKTIEHTPGPWSVERIETPMGVHYAIRALHAEIGNLAAVYKATSRPGEKSSDEGAQNARLIAAAPELLQALESAEMTLRRLGEYDECKRVQAAIQKAKGDA